jgi:hypothetical protein
VVGTGRGDRDDNLEIGVELSPSLIVGFATDYHVQV